MKAFLMMGQSNMAGRGDFGEVPEISDPRIFMLRNGRWQMMSEPINPDRGVFPTGEYGIHSGIGPAASFAEEYLKQYGCEVGLIPCADGGTRISQWQPGTPLFDHAMMQAELAMRSSEIAGILWHQGESDSYSIENIGRYADQFLNMIEAARTRLGAPDLPVIAGELGYFLPGYAGGKYRFYGALNRELHALQARLPRYAVASASGLTSRPDSLHFNSKSCREFGKRYFEAYREIVVNN